VCQEQKNLCFPKKKKERRGTAAAERDWDFGLDANHLFLRKMVAFSASGIRQKDPHVSGVTKWQRGGEQRQRQRQERGTVQDRRRRRRHRT
jgi:hypothetical protein